MPNTTENDTIENEYLKLEVSPRYGAGIAGFYTRRPSGEWLPLMRPTLREALEGGKTSAFSSFILMPYSNRIRDAKFTFRGHEYALRPNNPEGTARHGDVLSRAWTTILRDSRALSYRLDSRDYPDFNFPFPIVCTVTYRLERATLLVQLEIQNVGDAPMPAGFGLHPYFERFQSGVREATLAFGAQGVYRTPADLMPTEGAGPLTPDLDFKGARTVGDQKLDTVFSGWNGTARLEWAGLKLALELAADPIFSHFVVYTHYDGRLALEPVTHATDGFNLLERGVQDTGVRVLEPGEAMEGTVRFRVKALE